MTEPYAGYTFEAALLAEVERVRQRLADADINHFTLEIQARGRVHEPSSIEIKFSIGDYGNDVTGDNTDIAIDEWLRQETWKKRHASLRLAAPPPVEPPAPLSRNLDDEIPF